LKSSLATLKAVSNMPPFIKKHWLLTLTASGGFLILTGITILMLFSSIPGPDDPPTVAARERIAGSTGFVVLLLGAGCLIAGLIGGAIRAIFVRLNNRNG
jgi:hypothetical protein